MRYRHLLYLGLLLIGFSCTKEDIPADSSPVNEGGNGGGGTTGSVVFNVNKSTMLELINNIRKSGCKCGNTQMPPVGAVVWNDRLAKAAYDHSADMEKNNYFSHTGLNGSNPGQRITAAGYSWKAYGENIAKGYTGELAVFTGWINSEGHCRNIMNGSFKEMGAGREENYWTQLFGTK